MNILYTFDFALFFILFLLLLNPNSVIIFSIFSVIIDNRKSLSSVFNIFIIIMTQITLPDEIKFNTSAVKSTTKKTLLIQNNGVEEVKFFMISKHVAISCPTEVRTFNTVILKLIQYFHIFFDLLCFTSISSRKYFLFFNFIITFLLQFLF